jgi:hypothetical protein
MARATRKLGTGFRIKLRGRKETEGRLVVGALDDPGVMMPTAIETTDASRRHQI